MSTPISPVGPFGKAGKFAENMLQSLILNVAIFELIDWAEEVQAGMQDETLPEEVKAQIAVDYNEIQRRYNQLTGSMLHG